MQTRSHARTGLSPALVPLALAALAGCSSFPPASFPDATSARAPTAAPATAREKSGAALEEAARRAAPADQPALQLQAARAWLQAGRTADATRLLRSIKSPLTPVQTTERRVLEADIELANGQAQHAWQLMSAISAPTGTPAAPQYYQSRMTIALAAGRPVDGVRAQMAAEKLAGNSVERTQLRTELLSLLRQARARGVKLEPEASQDPVVRGWLDLGAMAGGSGGASLSGGTEAARWRARYPDHPATELLTAALPGQLPVETQLHKVALLLPISGQAAHYAAAIHAGFDYALQQLPAASRPQVQVYDTGVVSVDEALHQARAEGSDFIVGPLTRPEVEAAATAAPGVPILALNFLGSGRAAPAGFFQYALSPEDEARDVARRMLAAGQKRGAALGPTGDWGTRVVAAFRQELLAGGGTLLAQGVYDPAEHDFGTPIRALLGTDRSFARRARLQDLLNQKLEFEPRGRADLDFIFMPAQPGPARLLRPQLRFQYAGNVPVYATSDAFSGDGSTANQDLDGLIIPAMPWLLPDSGAAAALRTTVAAESGDNNLWQSGLYAFGFDACQLMVAIAAPGHGAQHMHVAGLTGDLTLGADGRVHREPDWARISRSGEPQLLGGVAASGAE